MRKNILFIILLLFTLSACTNNTDPKPIPTINDDIAALPSVEDITLNDADAILTIRQKIDLQFV